MPDVSPVESPMYSPDKPKLSPTNIARILAACQPLIGDCIDRVGCRIVLLSDLMTYPFGKLLPFASFTPWGPFMAVALNISLISLFRDTIATTPPGQRK